MSAPRAESPKNAAAARGPLVVRSVRFPTPVEDGLRGACGAPAYVRRARNLEAAECDLHGRLVRLWFERARSIACDVKNLCARFADDAAVAEYIGNTRRAAAFAEVAALVRGHPEYEAIPVDRSLLSAGPAGRLRSIVAGVRSFNAHWPRAVEGIDLDPINEQIDEFNRWYPLERECAMKYAFHALDNFRPRMRITHADLVCRLSLLPELE